MSKKYKEKDIPKPKQKCRTCRTKCKFLGMRNVYGRSYDQDGNDIDELFVAYLQD